MSDQVFGDEALAATPAQSPARAGALLRQAREAQGLHIAALAVGLKVPVKKLEALEAGRFEELPDMVFARSLALSVCRTLKIDPAPVMSALPESQASPFKANETSLNTTFKDSDGSGRRGLLAHITTPMGLAVLFLFVAIAVIVTWPEMPTRAVEAVSPAKIPEPVVANDQQDIVVPAAASSAVEPPVGVPAAPAAAPLAVPITAERPMASASQTAAGGEVLVNDGAANNTVPALLELSGRGESWVEVTDAAGQPKLRKILTDGEVVRVSGQLPLSVTVGRANAVSVSVRGKPFDLTPLVRENVARFEVK